MIPVSLFRVKRSAQGETRYYLYGPDGNLLREEASDLSEAIEYDYLLDRTIRICEEKKNGSEIVITELWFLNDHLGSTQSLADAEGRVVYRAEFGSYGEKAGGYGEVEGYARFTGKDYDEAARLYYFNAR